MSKMNLEIWGRDLSIDIVYDAYRGEEVLPAQVESFDKFIAVSSELFLVAEEEAKNYCLRMNKENIAESSITNIFKYVKPKAIYIKRETQNDRVVAILCAYKFNPDDGMAIVFRNETFAAIGTENIIL